MLCENIFFTSIRSKGGLEFKIFAASLNTIDWMLGKGCLQWPALLTDELIHGKHC